MSDHYAAAGVDIAEADAGVRALVDVLRTIEPGRPSLSVLPSGHYANVLRVAPNLGIAVGADGVGTKVIVAEQTGRYDTVGIDCIAMNVNDVICVGAEPIAVLDYLAVEQADPVVLGAIARGLKVGAEAAGVEIPGGELAQLPELVKGHPSPLGFDLTGACFGTVALDAIVTGEKIAAGDALIGIPASGVHSNGLTLARRALLEAGGLGLDERPAELGGPSVADVLLEPTVIYVRAVLDLLRSEIPVHGLAHITGGGVLNLLRLGTGIGYEIDAPLPVLPVFELIARLADVAPAEMWKVFNMGCGFVATVPAEHADAAAALLSRHHSGSRRIGTVTGEDGVVTMPGIGLRGSEAGLRPALGRDRLFADRDRDRVGAAGRLQLAHHVAEVGADGVRGERQLLRHRLGRAAGGDERQHAQLGVGERRGAALAEVGEDRGRPARRGGRVGRAGLVEPQPAAGDDAQRAGERRDRAALGDDACRAGVDGEGGLLRVLVVCVEHDGAAQVVLEQPAQQHDPVGVGERQRDERNVRLVLLDDGLGAVAGGGRRDDREAVALEQGRQPFTDRGMGVDDDDGRFHRSRHSTPGAQLIRT